MRSSRERALRAWGLRASRDAVEQFAERDRRRVLLARRRYSEAADQVQWRIAPDHGAQDVRVEAVQASVHGWGRPSARSAPCAVDVGDDVIDLGQVGQCPGDRREAERRTGRRAAGVMARRNEDDRRAAAASDDDVLARTDAVEQLREPLLRLCNSDAVFYAAKIIMMSLRGIYDICRSVWLRPVSHPATAGTDSQVPTEQFAGCYRTRSHPSAERGVAQTLVSRATR